MTVRLKKLQRCGTYGAYQRHRRNREDPCEECRVAAVTYHRDLRQKSATARANSNRQSRVQSRALHRLRQKYPAEFRAFFMEELQREWAR